MPGWWNGRHKGLPARGRSASGGKIHGEMNTDSLKSGPGAYVLVGDHGQYMYKGSARDLRKRVTDHMRGKVGRTKNRRPLALIHVEYTVDYTEARRRENWLKSGQGRKWLKETYAWVVEWQTQGT